MTTTNENRALATAETLMRALEVAGYGASLNAISGSSSCSGAWTSLMIPGFGHAFIADGTIDLEPFAPNRKSRCQSVVTAVNRVAGVKSANAARAAMRDAAAAKVAERKPIVAMGRRLTVDEARKLKAEIEQQLDQIDV